MGYITSAPCTLAIERSPESPASSSCINSPYAVSLMPGSPYPSRFGAKKPSSPSCEMSSVGNVPSMKCSPMSGLTSFSTNSRAVSMTIRSSAERSDSSETKSNIVY